MALQTNLYDTRIYFALIYKNVMTYILEPKNWSKISNRIPRDPEMFGFTSDFLEDKYGLLFSFVKMKPSWSDTVLTGGGELLKSINDTEGPDEEVYFEFGELRSNTPYLINRWRVSFDGYEDDKTVNGGVSVSIERMPFEAKYRARMQAPCTTNGYFTMDGQLLTPIPTYQLRLHSKTLLLESRGNSTVPQVTNQYSSAAGKPNPLILQPDQSNMYSDELPNVFTQPVGLINIGSDTPALPTQINIFDNFLCQYTARYSGLLAIENICSFDFWLWHNRRKIGPAGIEPAWNYQAQIEVQRLIGGVQTIVDTYTGSITPIDSTDPSYFFGTAPTNLLTAVTGADRDFCNKVSIRSSQIQADINVQSGDNIYVHLQIGTGGSILDLVTLAVQLDQYNQEKISYSQLTIAPSTTCDAYRIYDVLNQQLESTTGFKDRLIAPFFSPGGFGYKYFVTNGYNIRNFQGPAYAFKQSLKSNMESLQAIFCLGAGVSTISGDDYLTVDGVNQFFKRKVIMTFDHSLEWKNKNSSKYCFNKAELGFMKYEGLNIKQQEEYCTEGSFLLQNLKFISNTLSKKSAIIAAGTLIEEQRRYQFLANPGQSLANDNDIFIIASAEPTLKYAELSMGFYAVNSTVAFAITSLALLKGDTFVVTGGLNSGTVFTVVSEVSGYPRVGQDKYEVTPTPVLDAGVFDVEFTPVSPDQFFSERNDPFEICTNVPDPSSIYNGRLSKKQILYHWMPVLGVGLSYLNPTSASYKIFDVVTNSAKMNALFTTQFLSTEPNKGPAGDLVLAEITNEKVANCLANCELIYSMYGATCKVKTGWNDINTLRLALTGALGDDTKDNGGIVIPDYDGQYWFCHVNDLEYEPVQQIATFDLQKVEKVSITE